MIAENKRQFVDFYRAVSGNSYYLWVNLKSSVMKKLFTLVFLFVSVSGFGQFMEILDANNVGTKIPAGSDFFWDYDRSGFICPKGDMNPGTAAIFLSSLWLSAFDAGSNLKVAASLYSSGSSSYADFFDGPISNNYDAEFDNLYGRVWKINKSEIEYHQQHYTDAGYVMSASIANWRGNGRTTYGESAVLAPFQDVNQNGIYEPQFGDYPLIRGDQAIFKIMNDDRFPHTNSRGQKLGVELKMMFYEYATNDVLNNTVFLHVEITNKSGGVLNDFKLSNFVDIGLGCSDNDGVGCDPDMNLFFGYNRTANDFVGCNSGQMGYGNRPVSVGILSVCDNMDGFSIIGDMFNNDYSQPLSGSSYPNYWNQYRNIQDCKWGDGREVARAVIVDYNKTSVYNYLDTNIVVIKNADTISGALLAVFDIAGGSYAIHDTIIGADDTLVLVNGNFIFADTIIHSYSVVVDTTGSSSYAVYDTIFSIRDSVHATLYDTIMTIITARDTFWVRRDTVTTNYTVLNYSPTCFPLSGDVTDSTQWNEAKANFLARERSVEGTYNLGNFPTGETKAFDMAYFLTIDSTQTTDYLSVTNLMKQQSQTVKSHFLSNAPCHEIMSVAQGGSGINDVSLQLGISPNPSNGMFTITSDIQQGGVIGVYTITGAKVFSSKEASLNRTTIDISQQPKGIYIVKVNNSRGVWTQRVVVE